jgi:hypothetical protein
MNRMLNLYLRAPKPNDQKSVLTREEDVDVKEDVDVEAEKLVSGVEAERREAERWLGAVDDGLHHRRGGDVARQAEAVIEPSKL